MTTCKLSEIVSPVFRGSHQAVKAGAIDELVLSSRFKCTVRPMECTYLETGQKILFFGLDDPGKL